MNPKRFYSLIVLSLTLLIIAACSVATTQESVSQPVEVTRVISNGLVAESANAIAMEGVVMEEAASMDLASPILVPPNGEAFPDMHFESYGTNPFIDTIDDNLSTFAVDVDTGAYSIMRNYLYRGELPPDEAVRIEEYINYFDQQYPVPEDKAFAISLEGAPSPYGENERYHLVRVGIQGYEVPAEQRPDASLIFVIDVSGSMDRENRLGLVKESLRLLLDALRPTDRVGIVVYGSQGRVLLEPTSVDSRATIMAAIDELQPEGSTNAAEGLMMAYDLAAANARPDMINRLILLSDGVANVGETAADAILEHAADGISLSTFGYGMGNYNDVMMEQLADQGDGSYAYIDTLAEAERVFVDDLTGTLLTIAKDAKIQVEFDPAIVSRYRLLGYENRDVADEDFRDDSVDAGEIGAGHSVTALYEVVFQDAADATVPAMTVRVRYSDPETAVVTEIDQSINHAAFVEQFTDASLHFQLSAVVAEYAEILGDSFWAQDNSLQNLLPDVQRIAEYMPEDGEVQEFAELVNVAVIAAQ